MTTRLTLIQGVQKWVGQNQVPNVHILLQVSNTKLDKLGFAQEWARSGSQKNVLKSRSTVIHLHIKIVIKPC